MAKALKELLSLMNMIYPEGATEIETANVCNWNSKGTLLNVKTFLFHHLLVQNTKNESKKPHHILII